MATNRHQLFSYALQPSYAAASALSPTPQPHQPSKYGLSSLYGSSASAPDHYLPNTTIRYGSDYTSSSSAMYHHIPNTTSHLTYQEAWPPGVEVPTAGAASSVEPLPPGVKRTSEALYYPTIYGGHNATTEAWYATDYLTKRVKLESSATSHLPVYPQRPGEKDCTHYMQTRSCKFGDTCIFDHPIWVPDGGIPDWKEAPLVVNEEYPERPGEPDCPYYIKTQRCKYASRCKFNHPRAVAEVTVENPDALPERPSEPTCAFYMKTGKCKYGFSCKFNHPKDIQIPSSQDNGTTTEALPSSDITDATNNNPHVTFAPALYSNSKGLPVRPGEVDCPFYLKTGSCKYGATCRYNHPERTAFTPQASGLNYPLVSPTAASLNLYQTNPAASLYQTNPAASLYQTNPAASLYQTNPAASLYQTLVQAQPIGTSGYPQRPGQPECDFYMKTGDCKYGVACRFHHPTDRLSAAMAKQATPQPTTKLSLAGFPRREGALNCPYYMKTGTCKFGPTCKFDHPPPGEVMAKTTSETEAVDGAAGETTTE